LNYEGKKPVLVQVASDTDKYPTTQKVGLTEAVRYRPRNNGSDLEESFER
jgi:hypothetical protein